MLPRAPVGRTRFRKMPRNVEALQRLARFESLFQRDNLLLGLRMWLRVNLATLAIALVLKFSGLMAALGGAGLSLLVAISFFLFQWSATVEGRKLYDITPSPWCWWSIFWRLMLYMLPVVIVLSIATGPVELTAAGEFTQKDLDKLAGVQMIVAILSVIPQGLATSQALLVSLRRRSSAGEIRLLICFAL